MTSSQKPPGAPPDPANPGNPGKPQLQIQLPPEISNGAYVNLTLVNHTETEFVFDFIYIQPLEPRATVRSRVVGPRRGRAAQSDALTRTNPSGFRLSWLRSRRSR
jgi:hypothetical protein